LKRFGCGRTMMRAYAMQLKHSFVTPLGFPPNRGGFLYAASGWMAAIFSYSTGGSKPAELCRRRRL
jgi:hypothetical protein